MEVAIASAEKLACSDHIVIIEFDVDELGTSAGGLIIDFFHNVKTKKSDSNTLIAGKDSYFLLKVLDI